MVDARSLSLINTEPNNRYRSRAFIVVLLAIKPFIDLTWNIRLFSIGGAAFNLLYITGFCVFIISGYLYFFQNDNKRIFNKRVIWLFLGLNLFTSIVAISFYNRPVLRVVSFLLRHFDAYFIYFIGHKYIENDRDKQRIIGIIWITTFLTSILSTIQYFMGVYAIDITQNVQRFAGFYNDPGTPSYNAVMAIVFGSLYLEICNRQRQLFPVITKIAFILTLLVSSFMLIITITRSAVLMLVVFSVMWVGLYKRKYYLIVPAIIISGYYIYTTSEDVQARMSAEIEFLTADSFSIELARPMGTGRVAVWERLLIYYSQNFDLFQKLFGNTGTFGAHNQYLAYLMQMGIVGLTVFLIMLFRFHMKLIHLYKRYKQPEIYIALTVLCIFSVTALFGHPFLWTTLLWYLMILLSTINLANETEVRRAI